MAKKAPSKTEGLSRRTKIALGVGVGVAAAVAAAGTYFLYGKGGAKNRKKVRGWMLKIKGDVLEQMEKLQYVDESVYQALIDQAAKRYKHVDKDDLQRIVKELKGLWVKISKEVAAKKKKTKTAKRPRRKKATAKRRTRAAGRTRLRAAS